MQPVGDLLGDQGGVATGAVVDDEIHLYLVFYSLVHDLNGILDHLRTKCFASEEAINPCQQRSGSHFWEAPKQLFQKA